MRNWNLGKGDPRALTLACDARLAQPDYTNDQIWELRLEGGEPPALAVETTYGLRARSMRLFPRIFEGSQAMNDPANFSDPPHVRHFYPNFLEVAFSPFGGIDVSCEFWVPASQVITGRIRIGNQSIVPRQLRLEWTALLTPQGEGQGMDCCQMAVNTVLCGHTADLAPVLFMTGGPEAAHGSFPALALDLELLPGNQRQFTWALASLSTPEASFELARHSTALAWEPELARIELQNEANWIEVQTGDPDWDAAFALSQKTAFNLLIGSGAGLPYSSFVLSRQPDQGFSRRPDGSDYNHLWNGQSALDTYYLSGLLLPGQANALKDFLCNFLATRVDGGGMDWKPGIGGQRGRLMVQPILASIAWKIYQVQQDRAFLGQIFPDLYESVHAWIQGHDWDRDGVPEWDHPLQTGLEENPSFDRWHPAGQGLDVSTAEDPALCAFLVHECNCLIRMADQLKLADPIPILTGWITTLSQAAESGWEAKSSTYHYRDRDTHSTYSGEILFEVQGPVSLKKPRKLRTPHRLIFHIHIDGETTRNPTLHIFGEDSSGSTEEHITTPSFIWIQHQATITTQKVYTQIDRIEIEGITAKDTVQVRSADYKQENLSLLLPLWSLIPNAKRAQKIIQETLFQPDRYGHPFGFPVTPFSKVDENGGPTSPGVSMLWNSLLGEGLLAYGYREQAADLVGRLMSGLIVNLKSDGAFRRSYHAEQGIGSGERNILSGLAPLGLFLETLGLHLYSPWKVLVQGNNPFPWPVTVKYRGITVVRQEKQTVITFPDGQSVLVAGPGPRLVSLA